LNGGVAKWSKTNAVVLPRANRKAANNQNPKSEKGQKSK
jgi:hypothetical protein